MMAAFRFDFRASKTAPALRFRATSYAMLAKSI